MIPAYTIKTDSTSETGVTYIGFCNSVNADEAEPMWSITRVTEDGVDITVEHADGDASPDNVWSDRTSLTYR